MRQVTDRDSVRRTKPLKGDFHVRDLRFAGAVSAGLISAILVGGALLAPAANWSGQPVRPLGGRGRRPSSWRTPRVRHAPTPPTGTGRTPGSRRPRPASLPSRSRPLTVLRRRRPGARRRRRRPGTPRCSRAHHALLRRHDRRRRQSPTAVDNPLGIDSNDDGIPDQAWEAYGLDPFTDPTATPTATGSPTRTSCEINTDPNRPVDKAGVPDADLDFDNDGLRNGIEAKAGTKPYSADSNDDGVADGADDADGDGLTNQTEQDAGTAVDSQDTDGDGTGDGQGDSDGDGLSEPDRAGLG